MDVGIFLLVGADLGQESIRHDESEGVLVGATCLKYARRRIFCLIDGLAQLQEHLLGASAAGACSALNNATRSP